MRIFLNGIGAFGADAFNRLREQGDEIVAVAAPRQSLSGRADRLWALAEEGGILAVEPEQLKEPSIEEALRATTPDLGVMAFVQELIPTSTLELPSQGTIQYHPSLLPKHRGRNSINWSIIQGEARTGLSIFWPDEGLDTGPVLLQKEVEIGLDDTVGSLYRDKLYPVGIEALAESVGLVRDGKAPKQQQDESQATYEKPVGDRTSRVDWRLALAEIYNLVRGCDPSPGAWTRWNEDKLRLSDTSAVPDQKASPGTVISIDESGILIAAAEGALLVRTLKFDSGKPGPAAEIAAAANIEVGAVFKNPKLD